MTSTILAEVSAVPKSMPPGHLSSSRDPGSNEYQYLKSLVVQNTLEHIPQAYLPQLSIIDTQHNASVAEGKDKDGEAQVEVSLDVQFH